MSEQWVQRKAQSIHEPLILRDSSGNGITGVSYTTPVVQYRADTSATWTTVTLVQGVLGTYTSGSWVEDSDGQYQLDLPSTVYGTGTAKEIYVRVSGVSGQTPTVMEFTRQLVPFNPQDQFLGLGISSAGGTGIAGVAMNLDQYGNIGGFPTQYAVDGPITASATTLTNSNTTSQFPTTPYMLLNSGTSIEAVFVSSASYAGGTTTLTVERGQLGTTAVAFTGSTVNLMPLPVISGTQAVVLPSTVPPGYATSANQTTIISQTTSANISSAAAAGVLAAPTQKLATNTSGYVTITNPIPTPPTASQIATAVFTDLLSGNDFQTNGSFGYLFHAATLTGNNINAYAVNASSGGGGSGNGSVTVTVTSTATGTPVIPGATCSLNNSAGQQVASGQTNSSGQVVLSADAGTYTMITTLSGQYAPASQSFTMAIGTGNTASVSLTPITLPAASPGSLIAWAYTYRGANIAPNIQVSYYLSGIGSASGQIFNGDLLTAVSDANGLLSVALPYGTQWTFVGRPSVTINVPTSGDSYEIPSLRIV